MLYTFTYINWHIQYSWGKWELGMQNESGAIYLQYLANADGKAGRALLCCELLAYFNTTPHFAYIRGADQYDNQSPLCSNTYDIKCDTVTKY